mgnify:CR=1 FL=1
MSIEAHKELRGGLLDFIRYYVLGVLVLVGLAVGGEWAAASEAPAGGAPTVAATATPPAATPSPTAVEPSPVSEAPAPAESAAPVVDAPASSVSRQGLPDCEFEDGPGPCRWDASRMGNGRGRSYTIDPNGTTFYDDAKPAPVPGYSYAGQAHVWEGPTDGSGEAGIDSRYHDAYGYPKRSVLPDCGRVGSNESCAGPGYRILIGRDCSRLVVADDGSQYVADRGPSECVNPVTHQWPASGAGASPSASPRTGVHEDKAGLSGARKTASSSTAKAPKDSSSKAVTSPSPATASTAPVVEDVHSASPSATEAPAPVRDGGELAHTGANAGEWLVAAGVLVGVGVLLLAHRQGPRRRVAVSGPLGEVVDGEARVTRQVRR